MRHALSGVIARLLNRASNLRSPAPAAYGLARLGLERYPLRDQGFADGPALRGLIVPGRCGANASLRGSNSQCEATAPGSPGDDARMRLSGRACAGCWAPSRHAGRHSVPMVSATLRIAAYTRPYISLAAIRGNCRFPAQLGAKGSRSGRSDPPNPAQAPCAEGQALGPSG